MCNLNLGKKKKDGRIEDRWKNGIYFPASRITGNKV